MAGKKRSSTDDTPRWMTECDVIRYSLKIPDKIKEKVKKEAKKLGVRIGDPVVPDSTFSTMQKPVFEEKEEKGTMTLAVGKGFDDRIGTFIAIEAIRRLYQENIKHPNTVIGAATVQEEVGTRGVGPATHAIEPDFGIAIDGSLAFDIPWAKKHERRCTMGGGTGIYIMDRLTIGHPRLVQFLFDICEREGIPHQGNIGGGTDASVIQKAGIGAYCTTIGAPTRYMHSSVQMAHVDDIEATARLLQAFAENVQDFPGGI